MQTLVLLHVRQWVCVTLTLAMCALTTAQTTAGAAATPLVPSRAGWVYNFEASRGSNCGPGFLSYPIDCKKVDLWNSAGGNQEITLESAGGSEFYLKMSCGQYLSYVADCNRDVVDGWKDKGENQKFRFVAMQGFGVKVEASGRRKCPNRFVGPGSSCSNSVQMTTGGSWFAYPARSQQTPRCDANCRADGCQCAISPQGCADPWVWEAKGKYYMVCTGGQLPLYEGSDIQKLFKRTGVALPPGDRLPAWNRGPHRWAPETVTVGQDNFLFFSTPREGRHRLLWARADSATGGNTKWATFAGDNWFNLFTAKMPGGEIDPTVFKDGNRYYFLWKSDDNAVGDKRTRLWMQEINFSNRAPTLVGKAKVIMVSTGLWWVTSWVNGGSLAEGPEMIKKGQYYYLFFASGRFCRRDYAEGVARSKSIWGPFEKMRVPLLSTGLVGYTSYKGKTVKLVGPGHAGFIKTRKAWYVVWHASPGDNCERHAYASKLSWKDGWPFVSEQQMKGIQTLYEEGTLEPTLETAEESTSEPTLVTEEGTWAPTTTMEINAYGRVSISAIVALSLVLVVPWTLCRGRVLPGWGQPMQHLEEQEQGLDLTELQE